MPAMTLLGVSNLRWATSSSTTLHAPLPDARQNRYLAVKTNRAGALVVEPSQIVDRTTLRVDDDRVQFAPQETPSRSISESRRSVALKQNVLIDEFTDVYATDSPHWRKSPSPTAFSGVAANTLPVVQGIANCVASGHLQTSAAPDRSLLC
jgi:hypothetical protein